MSITFDGKAVPSAALRRVIESHGYGVEEVETPFRVWPTDLDVNRHMNNGKYLSIMDLGRVDLMVRSGLHRAVRRAGMYPVVASQTIRYRRSLEPFQRFELRTRVVGWDERFLYVQQAFVAGGEVKAAAVVKGLFLRESGGRVLPREVVALAGIDDDALELPGWVTDWVASEDRAWDSLAN